MASRDHDHDPPPRWPFALKQAPLLQEQSTEPWLAQKGRRVRADPDRCIEPAVPCPGRAARMRGLGWARAI